MTQMSPALCRKGHELTEENVSFRRKARASAAEASWHLQRGIHKLNQMTDQPEEQGISA